MFDTPLLIIKFCDLITNKVHLQRKKKLLQIAKKYAIWLLKTKKQHKTWYGKKSTWSKDFNLVKKNFINPFNQINKEVHH